LEGQPGASGQSFVCFSTLFQLIRDLLEAKNASSRIPLLPATRSTTSYTLSGLFPTAFSRSCTGFTQLRFHPSPQTSFTPAPQLPPSLRIHHLLTTSTAVTSIPTTRRDQATHPTPRTVLERVQRRSNSKGRCSSGGGAEQVERREEVSEVNSARPAASCGEGELVPEDGRGKGEGKQDEPVRNTNKVDETAKSSHVDAIHLSGFCSARYILFRRPPVLSASSLLLDVKKRTTRLTPTARSDFPLLPKTRPARYSSLHGGGRSRDQRRQRHTGRRRRKRRRGGGWDGGRRAFVRCKGCRGGEKEDKVREEGEGGKEKDDGRFD
jgi:hypothetical protein